MISVGLPATIKCDDEDGCTAELPAELCVMANGTLGWRPQGGAEVLKDWQVGVTQQGGFLTYCAVHKKGVQRVQLAPPGTKVQVGPAGLRSVKPNGH
jgi:hypothetical protein